MELMLILLKMKVTWQSVGVYNKTCIMNIFVCILYINIQMSTD